MLCPRWLKKMKPGRIFNPSLPSQLRRFEIKLLCGAGLFHPPSKSTIRSPALQSDPRCAVRGFYASATSQSLMGAARERGLLIATASKPLTETGEPLQAPAAWSLVFWDGGMLSKVRCSVKSCQVMRAMRRAVERMAVLAFLPRARLRL